jgi:DNA-binding NarL/FixJ family response regulator
MKDRMTSGASPGPEPGKLRVLVVGKDGGAIGAQLASDAGLDVHPAESLSDAERAAPEFRPEVLVVALKVPTFDDSAALQLFRAGFSAVPVLVVSSPADERVVTALIKAGTSGYLFSDETPDIAAAVREVARGGAPMSLPVTRIVLGRARRNSTQFAAVIPRTAAGAPPPAEMRLTTRQQQILQLLAGGHSYEDIGVALDLSLNTVRSHVKALYERLGASTKVEAVLIGMELHLLDENAMRRGSNP